MRTMSHSGITSRLSWMFDIVEALPAGFSADVMMRYAFRNDTWNSPALLSVSVTPGQPSTGEVLIACIVFGCSVSSFMGRRHEHDPFQTPVFIGIMVGSAVIGHNTGMKAGSILLCLVPWATCFALMLSYVGHGIVRHLFQRAADLEDAKAKEQTSTVKFV